MRTVFKMPGSRWSGMASISACEAISWWGAGSTPEASAHSTKKRFSATRSWAIDTQAVGGNVFEFGGDGHALAGQGVQRQRVVVGGNNGVFGHLAGRAIGGRLQHGHLETHGLGGVGEHAAQLAAAHHAQPGGGCGAGDEGGQLVHAGGRVMARAAALWAARNASS